MDRILDEQHVNRRSDIPTLPPLKTVREELDRQKAAVNVLEFKPSSSRKPAPQKSGAAKHLKAMYARLRRDRKTLIRYAVLPFLVLIIGFTLYESGEHAAALSFTPHIAGDAEALRLLSNDFDAALFPGRSAATSDSPSREPLSRFSTSIYTVRKGDTIEGISNRFGLWSGSVISANGKFDDANSLQIGEKLDIPNMNGRNYIVESNDSIYSIADEFGIDWRDIVDANALESGIIHPQDDLWLPDVKLSTTAWQRAYGVLFMPPTYGRITSPFGGRKDPFTGVWSHHYGVDIANSAGTPIRAANSGIVSQVFQNQPLYGNYVIIRHPQISGGEYKTLYGHLSSINVRAGQYVSQGQVIGRMGSTGRSTGPHLHFSIMIDKSWRDPETFVKELRNTTYVSNW